MNFWDKLFNEKKIVVGLSPMDGITDVAMRYMTAKYSNPDVLLTEFVSVDALHYAKDHRRERLLRTFMRVRDVENALRVDLSKSEQSTLRGQPFKYPYEIAQVFGHTPELFAEAAELVESLGFDGIDINMGCPMHKVEDQGSGAGLIRTPELAQEIIRTVKAHTKLPVSVKTRIGVSSDVAEWWMEQLMVEKPANITLHGRTLRQLYQGSADWESIGRAAAIVHKYGGHILGNGDVDSVNQAKAKVDQYKVDGVLIGRGAEGNPGLFLTGPEPSKEQRFAWMLEHAKLFEQIYKPGRHPDESDVRWFMPMRKHLAWYCKGFEGAVEMRTKLMLTNNAQEVEKVILE